MPAALNNAATSDNYTDALTVQFAYPRPGFTAQVYNNAATYQVGIADQTGRTVNWEPLEHFTAPAMLSFDDPTVEGFPPGSHFFAIRFKSAAPGVPASITVS